MSAKTGCERIYLRETYVQVDKEFIQEIKIDMKINIPLFNEKKDNIFFSIWACGIYLQRAKATASMQNIERSLKHH